MEGLFEDLNEIKDSEMALKGTLRKSFEGLRELLDELEANRVKDKELKEEAATVSELIVIHFV